MSISLCSQFTIVIDLVRGSRAVLETESSIEFMRRALVKSEEVAAGETDPKKKEGLLRAIEFDRKTIQQCTEVRASAMAARATESIEFTFNEPTMADELAAERVAKHIDAENGIILRDANLHTVELIRRSLVSPTEKEVMGLPPRIYKAMAREFMTKCYPDAETQSFLGGRSDDAPAS